MKMNELWLAFGGSHLTSTVSNHKLEDGAMIKVTIEGVIDESSTFITNVILAAIAGWRYDICLIDVRNFIFVEGNAINENAIECLIRLTGFAMNSEMRTVLVVDNGYVREVLTDILRRHRGFSRILIQSSHDFSSSALAEKG